jgi:hypothetical protein
MRRDANLLKRGQYTPKIRTWLIDVFFQTQRQPWFNKCIRDRIMPRTGEGHASGWTSEKYFRNPRTTYAAARMHVSAGFSAALVAHR